VYGLSLGVLNAQAGFFDFTPPTNTNLMAGPGCSASLQSGMLANPVVTSTIGANITLSTFNAVASGYLYTDPFPAPTLNLIVIWHVEDDQMHSHDFAFTVNILDLSPPVFNTSGFPTPILLNSVVQLPTDTNLPVSDNCSGNPTVTFVQSALPDTCLAGIVTRTWKATDEASNTTTYTQTFIISADSSPPTIDGFPQNGSGNCAQLQTTYPVWRTTQIAAFSASDPSGIKSLTNNAPTTYPAGCKIPLIVTFTARDNCNLTNITTAVFTTEDTINPVILSPPKDTVFFCTPTTPPYQQIGQWITNKGFLTAMDSCTEPNLLKYEMRVDGAIKDSSQIVADLLATFSNNCTTQLIGAKPYQKVRGKLTVHFTVLDACGNSRPAGNATIGIVDSLPPIITGTNATELCSTNDQQALNTWIALHGNATLTDGCSSPSWLNFHWITSGGISGTGTLPDGPFPILPPNLCSWFTDVTFNAHDDCNNSSSITLRFQLIDTIKPNISGLPPTDTLTCTNPIPSINPASISDNCDNQPIISYTAVNIDSTCAGTYKMLVTWSATDQCGNTGTATQLVFIRDLDGPTFTNIPPEITLACDTFELPQPPILGLNINATDNCSPVISVTTTVTSLQNPDPTLCDYYSYDIIRTFTASDACANTTTATQTIHVLDLKGPEITGLADTTVACTATPIIPPPSASDACADAIGQPVKYNEFINAGNCPNNFTKVLLWRAIDRCGNTTTFNQNIHFVDTVPPTLSGIPPDITAECNNIPAPANSEIFGKTDNCSATVQIAFSESEMRNPNPAECNHWADYQIIREWVATDVCNNKKSFSQYISIEDNTGPIIVPPEPTQIVNDPNLCGATYTVPPPVSYYDDCTALYQTINLRDTVFIPFNASQQNTPVDTTIFYWSLPNLPPQSPVISTATLTITINNCDINGPSEFFNIYGENHFLIGKTDPVILPSNCQTTTKAFPVSPNNLNSWISDGSLTITLVPAGAGPNSVNPTCANCHLTATLLYQYSQPGVPIKLLYSIDNQPDQPYNPINTSTLDIGNHTITYTAADCFGNISTAEMTLTVVDNQPPAFLPLTPITQYVTAQNCSATVSLPFPQVFENCDVSGEMNKSSTLTNVKFQYSSDLGYIPDTTNLLLTGLIPNAITGGLLKIRFRGNNAEPGEFFFIYDENNALIGKTSPGTPANDCQNYTTSMLNVSAEKINDWAADGFTSFTLVPNEDLSNSINNCNAILPDDTDGFTKVQALLEYTFAEITFEIRKNGLLQQPAEALIGNQTSTNLTTGNYQVSYIVTDINGVEGTTTLDISVLDTIKPTAGCLPTTIKTIPSGLASDNVILLPNQINNNSLDNCPGILNLSLATPNVFNCNDAKPPPQNIYPVTLLVTDQSGNTSTCTSTVQVSIDNLKPYFLPVCEGGILQLFTDSNLVDPNDIYTYEWKKNGVSFSAQRNPIKFNALTADEGTYVVEITGPSGCKATGLVVVTLLKLPTNPTISAPPFICLGDNIQLSTSPFSGNNVTYQWYEFKNATQILLGTTTTPNFSILTPLAGTYQYFVKIVADGCSSTNSANISVEVRTRPVANINPPQETICSGTALALTTNTAAQTYAWTGPAGFTSNLQNPLAINPCTSLNSGIYQLIITNNGCPSQPATLLINIVETPQKPTISGNTKRCTGDSQTLVCSVFGSNYEWKSGTQINNTAVNGLPLNNLTPQDNGCWQIRVYNQNCPSAWSDSFCIDVKDHPQIASNPEVHICGNDSLVLSANCNQDSIKWNWTGPNNFTQFGPSNQIIRTPGIAGTYTIIGINGNNCRDTVYVAVTTTTKPLISAILYNPIPCPNGQDDLNLSASVQSDFLPLNYNWKGPNNFSSFSETPTVTDVNASNAGTYSLTITDNQGCTAKSESTIQINNPLPKPGLMVVPDTICANSGGTVMFTATGTYPSNATYQWFKGSAPIAVTPTATYSILNPAQNADGLYKVLVRSDACSSIESNQVKLTVRPKPQAPTPAYNIPACEGDSLRLFVDNFNPNGTYQWKGPNGFLYEGQAALTLKADNSRAGEWEVRTLLNGCLSDAKEPITVEIRQKPKKPYISPDTVLICNNNPGSNLLQVSNGSTTPNASYSWIHTETNDTLQNFLPIAFITHESLNNQLPIGISSVYTFATLNGCVSDNSDTLKIKIDSIPNFTAFAGLSPISLCTDQELKLNADSPPPPIKGKWTTLGTPAAVINDPGNPKSRINNVFPGNTYNFIWSLSNGGCLNFSKDTFTMIAIAKDSAKVSDSLLFLCKETSTTLQATQGIHSKGSWSQESNQQLAGIYISHPDSITTQVGGFQQGTGQYFFKWTLPDLGCGPSTKVVEVRKFTKPYAGPDETICVVDSCAIIEATAIQIFETGIWSSNNPNLQFNNVNNNNTSVCNLIPGDNLIVWTTNNNICENQSRDTLKINFQLQPQTFPDSFLLEYGGQIQLDVKQNDNLPGSFKVTINENTSSGNLQILSPGLFKYQANAGFTGQDEFIYQICNTFCPDACSASKVVLFVGQPDSCQIPTLITPNQDNINDTFIIPPVCFPSEMNSASVTIFNQWGDTVFHNNQYDNLNGWDGNFNGQPLPVGTYYFVIQIFGEEKPRSGFILIQR
jgi:gliding motility-associated-like protein